MGCGSSQPIEDSNFHESYKLGRKLGEGSFGQVRVAKARASELEEEVAVKIVDVRARDVNGDPTKHADVDLVQLTRAELKHWRAVGLDEHCVRLQGSFFERNVFYMVMEKCHSSLMDKFAKIATMREADLCRIFSEMLAGIRHVHTRGIVHRDIKPDNFLFGGIEGETVKLCDFGLAFALPKSGKVRGRVGTAPYMCPEMLLGRSYNYKADVWSFGVTIFLMIHGDFPYMPKGEVNAASMKEAIRKGKPEIKFAKSSMVFSRGFVDRATPFLQALLQRSPEKRKTAAEAMELSFLRDEDPFLGGEVVHFQNEGDETALAPMLRRANTATSQEMNMQPIKQTALEELLATLQERNTYFSEGVYYSSEGVDNLDRQTSGDERIRACKRTSRRFSTHSGCMSSELAAAAACIVELAGVDAGAAAAEEDKPLSSSQGCATLRGAALGQMAMTAPTVPPPVVRYVRPVGKASKVASLSQGQSTAAWVV